MTLTPRSTPYLPPEIIDEILRMEELDKADLYNCCQVNKTWLDPARKSLYGAIRIMITKPSPSTDDANRAEPAELPSYLTFKSTLLLSTLTSVPALAQLVRTLRFANWRDPGEPDPEEFEDSIIWLEPDEAVATFARLCPRATEVVTEDPSFTQDVTGTFRSHCSHIHQTFVSVITTRIWEDLRHFEKLRRLSCSQLSLLGASMIRAPATPVPFSTLRVSSCRILSFKNIQPSLFHSVRHLTVPIDMVQVLQLSQFSQLSSLSFVPSYHRDDGVRFYDFRQQLRESSLEVFGLEDNAWDELDLAGEDIGTLLPSTCRRVNLKKCFTFNAILSVTQQSESGHRISELGLTSYFRNSPEQRIRNFTIAARALLSALEIELVWLNPYRICEFRPRFPYLSPAPPWPHCSPLCFDMCTCTGQDLSCTRLFTDISTDQSLIDLFLPFPVVNLRIAFQSFPSIRCVSCAPFCRSPLRKDPTCVISSPPTATERACS